MAKPERTPVVRLSRRAANLAADIQDATSRRTGETPGLGDIVERALAALDANLRSQRWLSGPEAAEAVRDRVGQAIAAIVGQVATQLGATPIELALDADELAGTLVVKRDGVATPVRFGAASPAAEN